MQLQMQEQVDKNAWFNNEQMYKQVFSSKYVTTFWGKGT